MGIVISEKNGIILNVQYTLINIYIVFNELGVNRVLRKTKKVKYNELGDIFPSSFLYSSH